MQPTEIQRLFDNARAMTGAIGTLCGTPANDDATTTPECGALAAVRETEARMLDDERTDISHRQPAQDDHRPNPVEGESLPGPTGPKSPDVKVYI